MGAAITAVAAIAIVIKGQEVIHSSNNAGPKKQEGTNSGNGKSEATSGENKGQNTNPYNGPVTEPVVVVVDNKGNAIPVDQGNKITTSPDGDYQQVRDGEGKQTGDRLDRGGHKGHKSPVSQQPHGHRQSVNGGKDHLPINN